MGHVETTKLLGTNYITYLIVGPEGEEVWCLFMIALLHPLVSTGTQKVHEQYTNITLLC
jgi:hypothetical protein